MTYKLSSLTFRWKLKELVAVWTFVLLLLLFGKMSLAHLNRQLIAGHKNDRARCTVLGLNSLDEHHVAL